MFDRIYRLTLYKNGRKEWRIEGSSAEISQRITFNVRLSGSGALENDASITVYGLSTDIVESVLTERRYDGGKMEAFRMSLEIGCREVFPGGSKPVEVVTPRLYPIVFGTVYEAKVTQLPERAVTFIVATGNLYDELASSKQETDPTILPANQNGDNTEVKVTLWLVDACKKLNEMWRRSFYGEYADDESITFVFDNPCSCEWSNYEQSIRARPLPNSIKELIEIVEELGGTCKIRDGGGSFDSYMFTDDPKEGDVLEVSEETGMIGMPRASSTGAEVDVILKKPILPQTSNIFLISKKVPPLTSLTRKREKKGVYDVLTTNIQGDTHGSEWKQTLSMVRPI